MIWRDDNLDPNGYPSFQSVRVCAEDQVETGSIYKLVIVHVETVTGKGFMPSVRILGGGVKQNGVSHLGEDDSAFENALVEGRHLMKRGNEDLNAKMAEYTKCR